MTDLRTAAESAGLTDFDLLKIAPPNLAPTEAVADLQRRFPAAFPTFKKVNDMSRAELAAFELKHLGKTQRAWWQA